MTFRQANPVWNPQNCEQPVASPIQEKKNMNAESETEKKTRILFGGAVFELTFAWWIGTVGIVTYIVGSA